MMDRRQIATQPVVAIHDSELTRALEAMPAVGDTPQGPGTTGCQWWPTAWHYFVMPESVMEALRSDGTAFVVVSDADISAGQLLDSGGVPRFPILISLAAEAIRDDEIQPLLDYVAAGGTLFVGSSSFTRHPDGTSRGDFAVAAAMGLHMAYPTLTNWTLNRTVSKQCDHRLVASLPWGRLTWRLPAKAEEIPWGTAPAHNYDAPHLAWSVQQGDAQLIASGDSAPYLLVKDYGAGRFIYEAAMQPLLGFGGWAPGMYAYSIFREAIHWAFEALWLPVLRLSPWPFAYNAALMVRHDFENDPAMIAAIESSAEFEAANHAKGDYFFCTGTLRVDMGNPATIVESLRRAVARHGATIGPHNGVLPNACDPTMTASDFDYWHWGPDEVLDLKPRGYPSGKAYALDSLGGSFKDIEGWLSGVNNGNGLRVWVAPYFNATREASYDLQQQLGIAVAGEQKLGPFPHWTLSTATSGKRYPLLSLPVSDWFVQSVVAQSMEWHKTLGGGVATERELVDFYYHLGALVNLYCHSSSAGEGFAGDLARDYVLYATRKPGIWATNSSCIYSWWLRRSAVRIVPGFSRCGAQSVASFQVSGASDVQTAVEIRIPHANFSGLQVMRNGKRDAGAGYRVNGQVVRILVGCTTTHVEVRYTLPKAATRNNLYVAQAGQTLAVPAPGVLARNAGRRRERVKAVLARGPASGSLHLDADGGFSYTPAAGFTGKVSFRYRATDGRRSSGATTVTIAVKPAPAGRPAEGPAGSGLTPWIRSLRRLLVPRKT